MDADEIQEVIDEAVARPAESSNSMGSVKEHPLKDLLEVQDRANTDSVDNLGGLFGMGVSKARLRGRGSAGNCE
jgi:hypothetical protein